MITESMTISGVYRDENRQSELAIEGRGIHGI